METVNIEQFFEALAKDQELASHSLVKFFLSETDEEKFKKFQKSGQGFLDAIAKLVNVEDHKIKEMKLQEQGKARLVDKTDELKLNSFLDSVKEIQACKLNCYDLILETVAEITSKYSEVCGLVFKLADQIGVLTAKTKEIEDLCSDNLKESVCQSQTYSTMKVALYSWSHEINQSKGNLSKHFVPMIKRLKSNAGLLEEVNTSRKSGFNFSDVFFEKELGVQVQQSLHKAQIEPWKQNLGAGDATDRDKFGELKHQNVQQIP